MKAKLKLVICALVVAASTTTHADEIKQSLKATVSGAVTGVFESDNDGINVVPVAGSFNIQASTKGFMGYPPPPGHPNRLSISCDTPKAPAKLKMGSGNAGTCRASYTVNDRGMMNAKPFDAQYASIGDADSYVDITKIKGKIIEAKFVIKLVDNATKQAITLTGTVQGEDRQMGSKGFY